MEQKPRDHQELIETTDSLEAVSASKSMKNFLFLIIFISMLIPQLIFWLDRAGLIEKKDCAACSGCVQRQGRTCPAEIQCQPVQEKKISWLPVYLTADISDEVERVTAQVEKETLADNTEQTPEGLVIEKTDQADEAAPTAQEDIESNADAEDELSAFRISCSFARGLVAICNFLSLFGAILYSLTILLCLKISLTGRLGGINHITRSLFLSLFLLVLLVPWQVVLPKVLIGSIWLPGELLCGRWARVDTSIFWKILFYGRFCGLWILTMWFLLWTQVRSAKWAHATLRRLGVVR